MIKAEQVGMSSKRLDRIGEVMRRLIGEKKIPGTVTLVARKDEVVHFEANGLRDVERELPMEGQREPRPPQWAQMSSRHIMILLVSGPWAQ